MVDTPAASDSRPAPRSQPVRRILKRLLLLTTATVAAALLVEVGLRLILPQNLIRLPEALWATDAELDLRHAPHLDLAIDTGERTVRLATDADGYRVAKDPAPETEVRVLALGDSFLGGLQVEYEETFAALLEDALARASGRSVRVANTGVGGWDPNHYRMLARRELARRPWNAVWVFLYAGNDVVGARYVPAELAAAARAQPFDPTLRQRAYIGLRAVNDRLERHSHAYKFLRDRLAFLRIRLGLSPHYFPATLLTGFESSPAWELTADLCAEIDEAAASRGVRTLFVLLPGLHQIDLDLSARYLDAFGLSASDVDPDQPGRRLGAAMASRGLALVDLTQPLRDVAIDAGAPLYGRIDTHLSAAGHRAVAALLEAPAARTIEPAARAGRE